LYIKQCLFVELEGRLF